MSLSVLVVENNPVIQRAVSEILEQEGCLVQTAENGLDALNKLKEDIPDLLFTDLVMPYVSGEQLCRLVKTNPSYSDIYIVIVTAMVAGDMHTILDSKYYDLCLEKGHLGEIRTHIRSALLMCRNDGHVSRKENTLISGVGDIEGLTAEVAGELF